MAIVKMKKLTLFTCKGDSGDVIASLMKLKCVEITKNDADASALQVCDFSEEKSRYETEIARIRAAIKPLEKYSKRKFALVKPKIAADRDEFIADGSYERALATVGKVEANIENTRRAEEDLSGVKDLFAELAPWAESTLPLDFAGTEKTAFLRVALDASADCDEISEKLSEVYTEMRVVGRSERNLFVELFVLKGFEKEVKKILTGYGYVEKKLPEVKKSAKALIRETLSAKKTIEKKLELLDAELKKLALDIDKLRVLCDIESTKLEALRQRENLTETESVECLSGWVPVTSVDAVEKLLAGYACAYEFEDPGEEDDPPVLLKNNKFASCFEWVIGLYSYPKYSGFDPTFIMAIFYCILFGLMFADAGYGLLFVLIAFIAVPVIGIKGNLKKSIQMFGWCGVSCIVMGILFGGLFGDLPVRLAVSMFGANEFQLALLLDPIKQPLVFLVISIGVGALHLITGMAIKFYMLCKRGKWLDALLDIGLWWVLFAGIALMAAGVTPWLLIGAAVAIVLTGGRNEKKWIMKPVKGLLGLYGLINYGSDLLSYSRILALGLASSIIAQVVNIMGTMGGNTVVGWIMLIAIGLVGHLINIGLNALGTFVHTSRLQYIEFFGKFYEDGGRKFKPASPVGEFSEID